jgi:hypothetical protein
MQKRKTTKDEQSIQFKILKVTIKTHTRLANLGEKSETFDSIINKVLDQYESRKRKH